MSLFIRLFMWSKSYANCFDSMCTKYSCYSDSLLIWLQDNKSTCILRSECAILKHFCCKLDNFIFSWMCLLLFAHKFDFGHIFLKTLHELLLIWIRWFYYRNEKINFLKTKKWIILLYTEKVRDSELIFNFVSLSHR